MRYLRGTKDYLLTYKRSDHLEVADYSDSDYSDCPNDHKSTSRYRRSYFLEECQIDTYSYLNHGSKVYSLLLDMAKRVGYAGLTSITCNFLWDGLIFSTLKKIPTHITCGLKQGEARRIWLASHLFFHLFFSHTIFRSFLLVLI